MNDNVKAYSLSQKQLVLLIILGIAFWFAAALTVRYAAPFSVFGATTGVITFLVSAPIGWVSVLLCVKVAKLTVSQIVPGIGVGLTAATLCDGIALTWFPQLYGSDKEQVLLGAAWILFGVGLFLFFAFVETYRRAKKEL